MLRPSAIYRIAFSAELGARFLRGPRRILTPTDASDDDFHNMHMPRARCGRRAVAMALRFLAWCDILQDRRFQIITSGASNWQAGIMISYIIV